MAASKNDDELDGFEEDLRRLKTLYDQFFAGVTKAPPMTERRKVEIFVHEFSRQKIRDNARRFRFNTLLSRFNQYRELWSRKMREREEGPLDFRRRQAVMKAPAPEPPRPAPAPPPSVTSNRPDPYVKVGSGTNGEEIRALYEKIEREHLKLGKLPSMSVEQLTSMVQKQSEMLRARYHVDTIAFRVETVDGKVKLKAKPIQEKA